MHGAALARRNLAMLDQRRGGVSSAMQLRNEQALDDFREAGDQVGMAHVLGQIARLDLENGTLALAGEHINEALATCRVLGNARVEVQIRYRLADLMLLEQRYQEAETELADLLRVVRDGHDIVGESRILFRLGTLTAMLGRVDEADQLFGMRWRSANRRWISRRDRGAGRIGEAAVGRCHRAGECGAVERGYLSGAPSFQAGPGFPWRRPGLSAAFE